MPNIRDLSIDESREFLRSEDIVCTSLDQLSLEEITNISCGFRPTNCIHIGNGFTFALAFALAEKVNRETNTTTTHVDITNCDLEIPSTEKRYFNGTRDTFAKNFYHIMKGRERVSDIRAKPLKEYFPSLAAFTEVSWDFQSYARNVQKNNSFREILRRFCERAEEVAHWFPSNLGEIIKETSGGCFIYPINPDTLQSNMMGCTYENGKIYARFEEGTQEFDIEDPNFQLAVHMFVDPLRDISQGVDVHVFGGDYLRKRKNDYSNGEKVAGIIETCTNPDEKRPQIFFGPIIKGTDGKKMSKSKGNTSLLAEEMKKRDFVRETVAAAKDALISRK